MIPIPCVIFAGGKSSRMGEDKALLPFGGFSTLTEFQYKRLQKYFSHVYISCKDSSKFTFNANFIEDTPNSKIFAPTIGFSSSFKKLSEDKFFVISVDTPFISNYEIQKLFDSDDDNVDATVAILNSKIQAMIGIYHRTLENDFEVMLENNHHKLSFLLKNVTTRYVDFTNTSPFLNLNHPSDYQEALNLFNTASL